MQEIFVRSRWQRAATVLAVALLSTTAVIGSAGSAAADSPVNDTPESAILFTSLPYEGYAVPTSETPAATDPAGKLVATSCNAGSDIYGTAWWKYTASAKATFVVHGARDIAGPFEEPIGLAVLTANLGAVRSCGAPGTSISGTGAITLEAGDSVYVVTYLTAPVDDNRLAPPQIGVYPSSGVVPTNDAFTSPLQIGTLPFSITQDTTLATREDGEPACYSKFGVGPSVWYSFTAPRDELVDIAVSSDYGAEYVVVPADSTPEAYLCSEPQLSAKAGVTYRIGVYGAYDEIRNSGVVTVKVSAAPAAPVLKIKLAATGTVKKKTGVVKITGTLTCSGGSSTDPVSGTLRQLYKRTIHQQDFTGTAEACTGHSRTWSAKVVPTTFIFKGKTKVTASVTACTTGGCSTATTKRTVKLKVS